MAVKNQGIGYFLQDIELAAKKCLLRVFFKPCQKVSPEEIDYSKIRNILIIRQHDPMGDIILSTAVFPTIKKVFPAISIDVLTRSDMKDIFTGNKYIDRILIFNKKMMFVPFYSMLFTLKLRIKNYDLAIVLGTTSISFYSLWLAKKSKAAIRVGIDGTYYEKKAYTDAFLTTIVPFKGEVEHQTIKNLNILKFIGINSFSTDLYVDTTENEDIKAEKILAKIRKNEEEKVIGIHIGAGKVGNRWPVQRFAAVSDILLKENKNKVILFTGPKEKSLSDDFVRYSKQNVVRLPGLSLKDFTAVVKKIDLLICNDTGVLHIAAAVGTKTVAIFGPTNPEEWNPLGEKHLYARALDKQVSSVTVDNVVNKVNQALS